MKEDFDQTRSDEKKAGGVFIFIFILAIALLAGLSFIVIRSVNQQVQQTVAVTHQLAQGNLTSRVEFYKRDEIGQIGDALNQAMDRMTATVKTISGNAKDLAKASEALVTLGQQMSGNSSTTADQAHAVLSHAERVSGSLQSIATAMEQMNVSIREIAQNARDAAGVGRITLGLRSERGTASSAVPSTFIAAFRPTLRGGSKMTGINFTRGGKKAYVISQGDSAAFVYDMQTFKQVNRLKIGVNLTLETAATTADEIKIYVASSTDDSVYVIDTDSDQVKRITNVGRFP